jgi:hypothetical protein
MFLLSEQAVDIFLNPLHWLICVMDIHLSFHRKPTISKLFKSYSNIRPTRCNVTQFILSGNCSTCFGWYHHPSSGAQTTVPTASGICHTVTATCRWHIPDAVDTVVFAPDDGRWYHPKHVDQFPDKINCVTLHLVGHILGHTDIYTYLPVIYLDTAASIYTLKHLNESRNYKLLFSTVLKLAFIMLRRGQLR